MLILTVNPIARVLAAASVAVPLAVPAVAFDVEVLYMTGDEAPGVPGAVFEGFGTPVINASGQVAFGADMDSGVGPITGGNDSGVWGPKGAGGLQLIAQEGDTAPGVGGFAYRASRLSATSST